MTVSLEGKVPDSWLCVDCGYNTAPGCPNRAEMEERIKVQEAEGRIDEGIEWTVGDDAEVYTVRDAVWAMAGIGPGLGSMRGCLCVGCLEKRIGRRLKPKDFLRDHPFNQLPGTERLLKRQKRWHQRGVRVVATADDWA
jgi:hypothetical protein